VCFGGWDVELTPRSLVSQPVMKVIEQQQPTDAAQSNRALTIQESIALAQRLNGSGTDRQAQEIRRQNLGSDRDLPSRYDDRQVRYDYDERLFMGQGTMTASSLRDTNFNVFDHMEQRYRDRHGSGDSNWVIRTNHGTR
jgi:hypothetical protein